MLLAPPLVAEGKFRILIRHQWKGMDFAAQAEAICSLTEKYPVGYIGIDATGISQGVYQHVRSFFPAARTIRFLGRPKDLNCGIRHVEAQAVTAAAVSLVCKKDHVPVRRSVMMRVYNAHPLDLH